MTGARLERETQRLLICSVGGTPEPIAAAIRRWQPARILFLCSEQTRLLVTAAVEAAAIPDGKAISPGCTDQIVLHDPQDLKDTLREMRALEQHVHAWQQRGDDYAVVVDFTGGTKVMSAALALVARRWQCTFTYVGGQQRNKDGVGVVVSGSETDFSHLNPWDALGYQAVEDAVTEFNHGGYAAAAALLSEALKKADKPEVKRELSTLKHVIDAYAAWDRFDHKSASQRFGDALKNRNDLSAIFPHAGPSLVARLERHQHRVDSLAKQGGPDMAWVEDLRCNAGRRATERRFDDAVARLYRALEALAQVRLREQHGIPETKAVPRDRLPEALRSAWANRCEGGDCLALGLQDAWRLLKELDDELASKFIERELADEVRSPLVARNNSILAHGFQPVPETVYTRLDESLRSMLSAAEADSHGWRLPAPG